MAFTYDLETTIGQIRLLIGDTVEMEDGESVALFTDEELQWFADQSGPVRIAAALALETLAASHARLAVRVARGDVSEDMTQVAAQLRAQADQFREEERAANALGRVVSPRYRTRCS